MALLVLVTGLSAELCMFHGLSQDRSVVAVYAYTVPDGAAPAVEGLLSSLVQGFLLVRAARVSRTVRLYSATACGG